MWHAGAIETAFRFFAGRASTGFIIPEWFPTPDNFLYHEAVANLDSAVYGIIDARQRELAASAQPSKVRTFGSARSMDVSAGY